MKRYSFTGDWYGKWVGLGVTIYWGITYWKIYVHLLTARFTIRKDCR